MSELPEKRGVTGIVLTGSHSLLLAGYAAFFASFLIEYIPNPQPIGVVAFLLVYPVYGSPAPVVFGIAEIVRAAAKKSVAPLGQKCFNFKAEHGPMVNRLRRNPLKVQ